MCQTSDKVRVLFSVYFTYCWIFYTTLPCHVADLAFSSRKSGNVRRERERERERETDRQRERDGDRERQSEGETKTEREREIERERKCIQEEAEIEGWE